jgi:hypothetical protein
MQKIEIHSTSTIKAAEEGVDAGKVKKPHYLRLKQRAIAAAALAAGILVQTQVFAQFAISTSPSAGTVADAQTLSGPEKAARQTWRAVMRNTPLPGKGCFHVSYPNVAWESVECKEAKPRANPPPVNRTVDTLGAPGAGGGSDYFARAQGLITSAYGKFFISGVSSETNVVTPSTPSTASDLILGSNEYSLQLNTNNAQTAACGDYGACFVWQQFMYGTDYNQPGEAALFMQYWLYNWVGNCPKSYWGNNYARGGVPFPGGTCFKNSKYAALPDIPVTNLGDVILSGFAANGGNDTIALEYGDDSWSVSAEDSSFASNPGLDIASVWNQAEFNVVGDMNLTQAQFNLGSQIIVVLQILDGSQSAPTCVSPQNNFGDGATGETNNMNLGTCGSGVGNLIDWYGCGNSDLNICRGWEVNGPYIEFTETVPFPHLPPPICIVCRIADVAPQQEIRPDGTTRNGTTSLN